jgi:hypothetical protein
MDFLSYLIQYVISVRKKQRKIQEQLLNEIYLQSKCIQDDEIEKNMKQVQCLLPISAYMKIRVKERESAELK